MVGYAIAAPVEVYDRARGRDAVSILPLASGAEPFHASGTVGVLGHSARLNITALLAAPTHKTGTPFHAGTESIPAPIRLTAYVSHLAQRHGDNSQRQESSECDCAGGRPIPEASRRNCWPRLLCTMCNTAHPGTWCSIVIGNPLK